MPPSDDPTRPTSTRSPEPDQSLLEACQAALAWVDAMERDDGTVNVDQQYWQWLRRMRAAVAQAQRSVTVTLAASSMWAAFTVA